MATTFSRISDVDIKLTVASPAAVTGLGNVMIITAKPAASASTDGSSTPAKTATLADGVLTDVTDDKSGANFKTYPNMAVLSIDYGTDTAVYKKAKTYFDQENPSDRISVLTYEPGKVEESLGAFWYNDWTFAIFADNSVTDDQLTASNTFEANENHILVLQREGVGDFADFQKQNYTVGCVHPLSEAMDAALLGRCASLTVGSITWKFKDLKDITPQEFTSGQKSALDSNHVIGYLTVHGKDQTSEGFTVSGEYIDEIHGEIWVKNTMEAELENLLQVNGKIPYDATGISMVQSTVTGVLQKATDQGIILIGDDGKGTFSVTATARSAQSATDLSARRYQGCSFEYTPSAAIHTVVVNGTVDSSTILS